MTLLQRRDEERAQKRIEIRDTTRCALREALKDLLPGRSVIVFGSLVKPGVFHERSDVDLALGPDMADVDALFLTGELSERLGRDVDIIELDRCRFRNKILQEGELWTL
jgi:predicted nucleotidyltransferase